MSVPLITCWTRCLGIVVRKVERKFCPWTCGGAFENVNFNHAEMTNLRKRRAKYAPLDDAMHIDVTRALLTVSNIITNDILEIIRNTIGLFDLVCSEISACSFYIDIQPYRNKDLLMQSRAVKWYKDSEMKGSNLVEWSVVLKCSMVRLESCGCRWGWSRAIVDLALFQEIFHVL